MKLPELKYDEQGLVPVIVQDDETGEVLMMAFANEEALVRTLETGRTHFWSRSRGEMWQKGATSGHYQEVVEVRLDCDADAVLVRVHQKVAACHTGYRSCFYRWIDRNGAIEVSGEKVFEPEDVYGEGKGR